MSYSTACGLTGTNAYCWGDNGHGELAPQQLGLRIASPQGTAGALAAISTGYDFTWGVTTGGQAYCWGHNHDGQLGDGRIAYRTTPTLVANLPALSGLAAGFADTCGLTSAGQAYCWGYNGTGELGNGSITLFTLAPGQVAGGHAFSRISAGRLTTCALDSSAQAYCWGLVPAGTSSGTPAAVSGGISFAALAAVIACAGGACAAPRASVPTTPAPSRTPAGALPPAPLHAARPAACAPAGGPRPECALDGQLPETGALR